MKEHGFGRWVAGPKTKWITLLVWIALVAILSMAWPMVNEKETNNAPNLPEDSLSVQADQVAAREFPSGEGVPALLVWQRTGGLTDEDLGVIQQLYGKLSASPVPYQLPEVIPFDKLPLPALKQQLSENGSSLVTPVFFEESAGAKETEEGLEQIQELTKDIAGANPFEESLGGEELSARVTGPAGISVDATGLFEDADVSLLIATVLIVLVILLLIYRSPILALIPLVAVGFAYGVISPVLGFLAGEGWITVDSQAIAIMTVLLFGAGTDYCLFLISRFRQDLREEESKSGALFRAMTQSSGAIAMSGITVVIAMLALLFAQYGAYYRFAIPFSLAILIMFIASLTLVPALLAILGRASFFPFVPRTPAMEEERAKRRNKPVKHRKVQSDNWIGRLVTTRPWTVVLTGVVLLGGLAAFTPQLKFTYDILSSFPEDMPSREGFSIIAEEFTPGELAPVKVMLDTEGQEINIQGILESQSFVSQAGEPAEGAENPNIKAVDVELAMNPYDLEAMHLIPDIRSLAESALTEAGIQDAASKVWVSGQTAVQYDTELIGDRDTRIIIPVVIGMITLLLLLYLRSVVATVYLVLTVILSYFSALGLGWLVLHYGWGAEAIQGSIPLYSFVFLVALGEDYNIFMISSIWKKSRHMPLKQAIREGVHETGSVITSAGLILAATFAVLATLPIQVLVQFGVITAIGVLLDTFIVRPFLVPAITTLLGRRAFWPGKAPYEEGAAVKEQA
ncbi:MMPL family transporter [Paenibacillus sp. F411]|uniref:MMPL family transporter n=1 Tax=Paenibacillus sp. F411 TaxID=2820239 RepID=UPI001AAE701B|nr:MMPL family transporter [Paenibacillus sp. F411]MBO2944699.1 MMPL family transporter [Paenibacillus sp. F411]